MPDEWTIRSLEDEAKGRTDLEDFGSVPYEEPLSVFLDSLALEAKLDDARRAAVRETIVALLAKRLRIVDDRRRFPAITSETVRAPLFIVGAPRSGSTHLHALMGCVDGVRVPMFWEMTMPSPPPERATAESDARIEQIRKMTDAFPDDMQKRHPIAAMRPEQCNLLCDWSFINFAPNAAYSVPTYRDWFFDADHGPAYQAHHHMLQHLQWKHPGQWVLKYPKHLFALDHLIERYPDARFVWTHRDPAIFIPSVASLTGHMRSPTPGYDSAHFGREWATLEELSLRRGIEFRDRRGDLADRHLDIHYPELMKDPVATVRHICQRFSIDFDETSANRIHAWLEEHPQKQFGVHRYGPEEYGFSTDGLRRRFAFYSNRFDIEPDRAAS